MLSKVRLVYLGCFSPTSLANRPFLIKSLQDDGTFRFIISVLSTHFQVRFNWILVLIMNIKLAGSNIGTCSDVTSIFCHEAAPRCVLLLRSGRKSCSLRFSTCTLSVLETAIPRVSSDTTVHYIRSTRIHDIRSLRLG